MATARGDDADVRETGADDVVRTLELLWEPEDTGSRSGRGGLSREAIVQAAVEIADRDGLDAVSMRAVAKALGAGTMSLYRHVRRKDELLALMVDEVTGRSVPEVDGRDWREGLRRFAIAEWELTHRHPWMAKLGTARVVAGPATVDSFEAALAAAAGTGLSEHEVVSIVTAVMCLSIGAVQTSVDAREVTQRTGMDDARWWEVQSSVLERHLDDDRTPVLLRVLEAGALEGDDDTHRIEYLRALELLLDGVEQRIARSDRR